MEFGKKKEMSANEKKAKLAVLKDMHKSASSMLKDDLDGAIKKKVTVAADSEEGLKAGLKKAEEVVSSMSDDEDESKEEESEETDEASEMEECSEEELDAKIQELMAMKAKLKK